MQIPIHLSHMESTPCLQALTAETVSGSYRMNIMALLTVRHSTKHGSVGSSWKRTL
jgi:hypothetical protein